jgi:O-antigen ligase
VYTSFKSYYYLISLFPFFFVTGSFLPDFICSLSAVYFLYYLIKTKETKFLNNKFFYFFLLFYLYINLNSLNSFQPLTSFKTSLTFIRIILFIFFIAYFIKKNPKIIDFTYYCFFLSLLLLFADTFIQFFFKINIIGLEALVNKERYSSFFGDELIMGSYVARLLPFIIGLSYLTILKKKNLLNSIIIILAFILVILSGERTSLFYLLFFLFFYFLANKKQFCYFLLPIAITIIIIINLYNPSPLKRIGNHTLHQFKESKYLLSYRHELHLQMAYQMFLDKKFFGHGLKSFRNLCGSNKYNEFIKEYKNEDLKRVILKNPDTLDNASQLGTINDSVACNTHPHNIYFEFLAELGIFGFFFLVFLFLYVIKKCCIYFTIVFVHQKKKSDIYGKFFILLGFLISMLPFLPSGSYFNNYMLIITYFPVGFYLSRLKI